MKNILIVIVLITCLISCLDSPKKHETKTIILSKASANYIDWIEDDNMVNLIPYFKPYKYDKENPGVIIEIISNKKTNANRQARNKSSNVSP